LLLAQNRPKFKSGPYLDALFAELQEIDGTRSSSRKDDRGDAISWVAIVFRIYSTESNKATPEDANEVEKMQRKAALLAETQRYFGGTNYTPPPKAEPPPTPQPQQPAPRFRHGGSFATLPSGFRGVPTPKR
jgi:hypothetical protein